MSARTASGWGIADRDSGPGSDGFELRCRGAGRDAAIYASSPGPVNVDLGRRQATGSGNDQLTAVETVLGSRFADVLVGDGGRNHLAGQQGNDRLSGSGGSDLLDGGRGTDVLDGGAGPDLCIKGEKKLSCP